MNERCLQVLRTIDKYPRLGFEKVRELLLSDGEAGCGLELWQAEIILKLFPEGRGERKSDG